jgi:predicted PurR-regulated permease PerM
LPFALRAGAEFFLPVTAALVIAIALVPVLEWLERRRIPSALAALLCVLLFLTAANVAIASIVLPATEWVRMIPANIGRMRETLAPLLEVYSDLEEFLNNIVSEFGTAAEAPRTVAIETPNSALDIVASSAHSPYPDVLRDPGDLLLSLRWTRMRKATITTPRKLRRCDDHRPRHPEMVDATSTYLGTSPW